jgi:ATP-dependent DNA helicase RecG
VGNQFRCSEFLCLSLGKPPRQIATGDKIQWHDLAQKFASYSELSSTQRKQLVISTRNFLQQQKAIAETPNIPPPPKTPRTATLSSPKAKTYFKAAAFGYESSHPKHAAQEISLDQPLSQVIDIGRRSNYLERLRIWKLEKR